MIRIAFKPIVSKSTFAKMAFAFLVAGVAAMTFCESSLAQKSQSKVEAYLNKKDANRNGRIEPDEMSESTKKYLTKMGYNPSKPITISKIVAKADKADRDRDQERKSVDLKVPGFGVDSDEGTGVRSFNSSDSVSKKSAAKTYSSKVLEQTKQTLDRYDRNKDGALDKSEMERARWGSPKPSISDLNRDGRLSRTELNERYSAREKSSSSSGSSSSKSSSVRKEDERSRSSGWSRPSSSGSSSSRTSSSRSTSSGSSSKTSASSSSSKSKEIDYGKYQKYAASVIKNYDKDGDGKLSKAEVKKMRRPPAGADTDDDGFVSETELIDSLSGANKDKTASKGSSSTKTSSSSDSRKSTYRRSSSSSSRTRSSSSLEKLDTNGDNQVQMHEFAEEWDDDVVAEYYEKDKNGDGVITAAEWSSR